jgi:sugar phosphate isomerase/epimerase
MTRSISIGIMQGRLSDKIGEPLQSFPAKEWRKEFSYAEKLGFDQIEWLYDGLNDENNPIKSDFGIDEIIKLSNNHKVKVNSLCAHKFLDGTLFDNNFSENAKEELSELLLKSTKANIDYVILPIMDSMSINTNAKKEKLKNILDDVLNSNSPIILLECDLPAVDVKNFIDTLSSDNVKVLYDLGNATALGFDIKEELILLNDTIGEIHVKDRFFNGGMSSSLGSADTNFELAAKTLSKLLWSGSVVLETPTFNNSYAEAEKNITYAQNWVDLILS